jgi:hypothetical protein
MAAEDFLRSHPFAFKKDSTLGPAAIPFPTSLAATAPRGGEGYAVPDVNENAAVAAIVQGSALPFAVSGQLNEVFGLG